MFLESSFSDRKCRFQVTWFEIYSFPPVRQSFQSVWNLVVVLMVVVDDDNDDDDDDSDSDADDGDDAPVVVELTQ